MKQYLDALILSYLEHMHKVGDEDPGWYDMYEEVKRLRKIQERRALEQAA